MKLLFALLALSLLLGGCASAPVPYDAQFATIVTRDADGVERAHAWVIGAPSKNKRPFEYDRSWPLRLR
jgi:hypothetical protein